MANFILRQLFRITASKVPTSLLRFRDIRQVSVLVDADAPDAPDTVRAAHTAFPDAEVTAVQVHERKGVKVPRDTQVLITLLPRTDWKHEYAIRHSRAVFKAGRMPMDVLNLVVSDPEGRSFPQSEVLSEMVGIIKKLK